MIGFMIMGLTERIKSHLEKECEYNLILAEKMTEGKTIKGCCEYIVGLMKDMASKAPKVGNGACLQVDDEIVYSMAVEYFMNDEIKETKKTEMSAPKAKGDKVIKKETKPAQTAKKRPLNSNSNNELVLSLFD